MRVGSGVILFQLAGFLTSALADFYFAKHTEDADLILTHEKLYPRAIKEQPGKEIIPFDSYLNSPVFDEVVQRLAAQE